MSGDVHALHGTVPIKIAESPVEDPQPVNSGCAVGAAAVALQRREVVRCAAARLYRGRRVDRVDDQLLLTSERAALVNFLNAQREGLIRKLSGLDDAQARTAPTASSLSLLGLIKHAATWEWRWFGVIAAGRNDPDGWPEVKTDPRDADLFVDQADTVERWVATYRRAIAESNVIVEAASLDGGCARTDIIECNVRYILYHMIEETARHAGHADIIRETIDGATGY